jgi:hypothetical protein
VRIGGIVSRATHRGARNGALNGGPQMVEISRDGRRVYFTNSLYGAIDPQIPTASAGGWRSLTPSRRVASLSTRSSSCSGLGHTGRTRYASREATARRIPTVILEKQPGGWRIGFG